MRGTPGFISQCGGEAARYFASDKGEIGVNFLRGGRPGEKNCHIKLGSVLGDCKVKNAGF